MRKVIDAVVYWFPFVAPYVAFNIAVRLWRIYN
jgi:hypothetical protein